MAIQMGDLVRSARVDAVESTAGASAKLQIRTGAQPATCATADAGTLLCEITLPSDWMAAASAGVAAKSGTWQGTASAAGVAAHFRIKNNAGTVCHMQGSVGQGSGDLSLDNTNIANGQVVTISSFSITDGNP